MEQYTDIDKQISDFIFTKPEIVSKILIKHGYFLPKKTTLQDITISTFHALYDSFDNDFAKELEIAIMNEGYANFADPYSVAISSGLSIISSILGGNQARKQRQLQEKIALAQLSQTKMLEEEKIRTGAETERTKILLNSLQQYQSDLQNQSTLRVNNVWIYAISIAVGIGILYGLSEIIKK